MQAKLEPKIPVRSQSIFLMLLADITVILRKGGGWESMNNKEKLGKQLDEPFSQFNKKEEEEEEIQLQGKKPPTGKEDTRNFPAEK